MLIIPTTSEFSSYTETVQLNNETFEFEFNWMTEQSVWMCSIYTADESPIVLNEPIYNRKILFLQYSDERLPQGSIIVVDRDSDLSKPIGRYDLGSRIILGFATYPEILDIIQDAR